MHHAKFSRPPTARMFRIHEELKRGAVVTSTLMGKLLEVSPKTILRDLEFMRDQLKLPIKFDSHRGTYLYWRPVETFPAIKTTEGDVVALLLAQKALEQYRGTSFHAQLAASFQKMAAGLRDEVSFTATDELQHISFKSSGAGKADLEVFNTLSRAVLREREVHFDYRKPGEPQAELRRVRPYHLAHRDNLWYLVAFDLKRNALRTFAVPRITRPQMTRTTFKRPKDFSAEKYFANALAVLGGDGDYTVVIQFSAAVADRVREREWHESQRLRELPNGRLEFEIRLGALPEIERWVLTWGAHAQVVGPPELRARMKETAEALMREYQ